MLGGCKFIALTKLAEVPLDPVRLATEPLDISHVTPSNHRDWEPDQAVLPQAEYHGDEVTVSNIRNCLYLSKDNFAARFHDKTFDLNQLQSVDFIVVPFRNMPSLAHIMLSFGFADGEHLVVSVEVRREKGETYNPFRGLLGEYEIMYVVGEERDLIALRLIHRQDEVYLYRTKAAPAQARALFEDVFQRINKLREQPEFYHTVFNNCSTNLAQHVNRLSPNRIPYDPRVLLSGYSDRLAFELGLLETDVSFEETKRQARITNLAPRHASGREFSRDIRRRY